MVKRTQGMNWIRKNKRLAIYLRDGMACLYCGDSVVNEVKLTLDHLKPYSKGGSNDSKNLITCCLQCNSKRGNRRVKDFAAGVAGYNGNGMTAVGIMGDIKSAVRKKLDMAEANNVLSRCGSFVAACKAQ